MHRSPPRSRKNFNIRKSSMIWQIWHRHFRFDHSVLIDLKVVINDILNNLYLHDKLLILHCSPSGSLHSLPKSQIWRYFESDNFQWHRTVFWSKWIMSKMIFTTILNTVINSWRCTFFILRAFKIDQNLFFCEIHPVPRY